jgi:protocatechuate 3,4-dioxygenase beta subunit
VSDRLALLMALALLFTLTPAPRAQDRSERPGQQQQQQPSRDTSARPVQAPGTAMISGRVLDYQSGRPMKRARVSVTAPEISEARGTMTDENGHYEVTALAAGRYTISVSKNAYVTVSYGQRKPGRSGKPLPLRDGQQAKDIDFRLPRGSVITGRILDEDGEPLLGANVRAMRYQYVQGQQRIVPAGVGQTDDRGQYRIYGLMPGNYFVSATARLPDSSPMGGRGGGPGMGGGRGQMGGGRGAEFVIDANESVGYPPTYYPGVPSLFDATFVPVNLTQEVTSIDIPLQLVRTARVGGVVIGVDGAAAANATVALVPDDTRGLVANLVNYAGRTERDGTFTIGGVPPGRYVAVARGQAARDAQPLFARHTVVLAGQDLMGVSLALTPGAAISGAVTFESGENAPPTDLTQVRITATSLSSLPTDSSESTRAQADGRFALNNVGSGPRLLRAAGVQRPWVLKGVFVGGRDVSDLPTEFKAGERLSNVSVIFSDRTTEITGAVGGDDGQPVIDYLVVAFSADQAYWVPQSRRISTSRPDQNGAYHVRGLPIGDYLLVAIDDAEQGQWYDPAFLDALRPSAARVTVADGETKSQNLRLIAVDR